jgi:hypothetical protein
MTSTSLYDDIKVVDMSPDVANWKFLPGAVEVRRAVEVLWGDRLAAMHAEDGRLIQIMCDSMPKLLMDRRMARRLAEAILEIAGPPEEIPTDVTYAGVMRFMGYTDDGALKLEPVA